MPKSLTSAPSPQRLRAVAYFVNLPHATLEALASIAIARSYLAGATIFLEGEPATDL